MPTNSKQLHQVIELAVNISADDDWSLDCDHVGLSRQDSLGLNGSTPTLQQSSQSCFYGSGLQASRLAICCSRSELIILNKNSSLKNNMFIGCQRQLMFRNHQSVNIERAKQLAKTVEEARTVIKSTPNNKCQLIHVINPCLQDNNIYPYQPFWPHRSIVKL